jgi:hypothetical protein
MDVSGRSHEFAGMQLRRAGMLYHGRKSSENAYSDNNEKISFSLTGLGPLCHASFCGFS